MNNLSHSFLLTLRLTHTEHHSLSTQLFSFISLFLTHTEHHSLSTFNTTSSLFLTHTFRSLLIFAFLRVFISLFLTHTFKSLLIFAFLRVFISLFLTNTFKYLLNFSFFLSIVCFDLKFVFVCFRWDKWNEERIGQRQDSEAQNFEQDLIFFVAEWQ